MKHIKILISDRNYHSWEFICNDTNTVLSLDEYPELKAIHPIERKLFSRDTFTITDKVVPRIEITKSYIKSCQSISGVLQLENNKTFGRTANKKRLLYKCIPDDKHLPVFLIPYEVKLGFSKVQKNKYLVFKFEHWNDKHPQGIIQETIGDVDSLEAFYEYQLYCKSLHISITDFTNKTREQLNKKTSDDYVEQIFKHSNFVIEDRRNEYIFTIDPLHSTDFDDGYSIKMLENGSTKVSIYIANVYFWLETLSLWNSLSKRVATIYLPDRRRPMLPTILSDTLCSLQESQQRFAMVMDIIFDENGNYNEADIVYKNVLVNVKKNYVYEEPKLAKDKSYQMLYNLSKKMDLTVEDSHDVVAYWMVFMNTQTGSKMVQANIGIYRSVNYINPNLRNDVHSDLDGDTCRIIQTWNNSIGQYVAIQNDNVDTVNLNHDLMKTKAYVQINSSAKIKMKAKDICKMIEKENMKR
jgi:exoribonuclease R